MKVATDPFWRPSVRQDVEQYVKACDTCQSMKLVPRYVSVLARPVIGLFEVFSMDFAGPFLRPYNGGPQYLFVCVERLTGWPVVRAKTHATAKTVIEFTKGDIIHSFGPPNTIVTENAGCFTEVNLSNFIDQSGTDWKTGAAYAQMSNGKAERLAGTIRKAVGCLVEGDLHIWAEKYQNAVAGYHHGLLQAENLYLNCCTA